MHTMPAAMVCPSQALFLLTFLILLLLLSRLLDIFRLDASRLGSFLCLLLLGRLGVVQLLLGILNPIVDYGMSAALPS